MSTMNPLASLACLFNSALGGHGSFIRRKSCRILGSWHGKFSTNIVAFPKWQIPNINHVIVFFLDQVLKWANMGNLKEQCNMNQTFDEIKTPSGWCWRAGTVCIETVPAGSWSLLAKGFNTSKLNSPHCTLMETPAFNGGGKSNRLWSRMRCRTTSELSHSSTTPSNEVMAHQGESKLQAKITGVKGTWLTRSWDIPFSGPPNSQVEVYMPQANIIYFSWTSFVKGYICTSPASSGTFQTHSPLFWLRPLALETVRCSPKWA